MEALVDGGNSFSQGIQLKMMVTQFEEWARNKAGAPLAKVAEKALDPAREVRSSSRCTILINTSTYIKSIIATFFYFYL